MNNNIIIIVGPTGVGKSQLSINLAKRFQANIVSADSMQIYKYMNIGTAKPSLKERILIQHYLLDLITPDKNFNAAIYIKYANNIIKSLNNKQKQVFLVGGTGLYIKLLINGITYIPPENIDLRKKLNQEMSLFGKDFLYKKLMKYDAQIAKKIHPNDIYRIKRAIEIIEITGKPLTYIYKKDKLKTIGYNYLKIGINREKNDLVNKIIKRTNQMMKSGLIEETEALLNMGYHGELKPMKSLIYKNILKYLRGFFTLNQVVEQINIDTYHYAKRQLTWFKKDKEINWFHPDDNIAIENKIANFLEA